MNANIQFDRNAVITIQGGGLYGLTLLGQLSAVADIVDILAIAGTSAGAIIAALVWAGWSPDDLCEKLREQARLRILHALPGDFDVDPPFDLRDWLALTRDLTSVSAAAVRQRTGSGIGSIISALAFSYDAWHLFRRLRPHYAKRGFFLGNHLERVVEGLLREGLGRRGCDDGLPDRSLTFGDVRRITDSRPEIYFPPLVLAATNLGTQNVELINSIEERYENVSIARAVRASSGYPVFFQPVEIPQIGNGNWYIDGGVISNFPAWVFSSEFREKMYESRFRAIAYRPWVHIGLRLIDEDVRDDSTGETLPLFDYEQLQRPSVFAYALSRLMLGQARNRLEDLISGTLARSLVIAQPYEQSAGPQNLFDFDSINERRVCCMYSAGAAFGKQQIKQTNFDISAESHTSIACLLETLTVRSRAILDPSSRHGDLRVRANIFLANQNALRLEFPTNMSDPATGTPDPDVTMRFDAPDQGLTGFCFTLRRPLICNLAEIGRHVENAGRALFNMSEEQQSLVLRQQTWLASMPIFDPNDLVFRSSLLTDIRSVERQFATDLPLNISSTRS
jgi:predicted acylesterase/phospholipase RssA